MDGNLKVLTDAVKELETDSASQQATIDTQTKVMADQATLITVQGKQIAEMMAAMAAAQKASQERDDRVDGLADTLASFLAPIGRAPPPAADGCRSGGGPACAPSVESGNGGGDGLGLQLKALSGPVILESKECAATDLCGLVRDLQTILTRFDLI